MKSKESNSSNQKAPNAKKKQQKYIFIAAGAALLIILVSIFVYNQTKINEFNEKNQALLDQNGLQDSLLTDFMGTFNEFAENLDQIKEREGIISVNAQDPNSSSDQINEDLQSIDQLLLRNREIIDELNAKVDDANKRNSPLRRSVAKLSKQLKEKEAELTNLTGQLASLNIKVDTLNLRIVELGDLTNILEEENTKLSSRISEQEEEITTQDEEINDKTTKLNTAFYIAATAKELKKRNIIVNKRKLNHNFDQSAFTKVDITQINSIPIDGKKAKVLTYHPSESYELSNTDEDKFLDQIEIKDPASFWRNTKYLVVVLN